MKYQKTSVSQKLLRIFCTLFVLFFSTSCDDTDLSLVTGAGIDTIKAITLSDAKVVQLANDATDHADNTSKIAPPGSSYALRLNNLVGEHLEEGDHSFSYKVYLSPEINAFAMANGSIRVNSALMDMMSNGELRFIIGHEMGHVVERHIKKKMMIAYGGSALRKAIASQNSLAGDISRSVLGSFTETLLNAQFSQQEEREADDYGLEFLIAKGYERKAAVSALQKLATLGANHSFLSSHPAPDRRAVRLEKQLNGEAVESTSFPQTILAMVTQVWNWLLQLIISFF